jgi:hypothetical protein
METTLSLALMIKQCESGMPTLEHLLENLLRGIQAGFPQLPSHQMETTLSLAHMIKQGKSGMSMLKPKSMWYLPLLITEFLGIPPKSLMLLSQLKGMIEVQYNLQLPSYLFTGFLTHLIRL